MTDDDDIPPAFSTPPDDAHPADIAERVMGYPEHQHLREHEVRFGWLMRSEPKEKGNRVELGSVHDVKHLFQGGFKDLGLQLLSGMLGGLPDYLVVINGPWWRQASAVEREALVFHELAHVQQAIDSYGALKFDRDGLPVFRVVGHDVEEFKSVVARYGLWKSDVAEFADVVRRNS